MEEPIKYFCLQQMKNTKVLIFDNNENIVTTHDLSMQTSNCIWNNKSLHSITI